MDDGIDISHYLQSSSMTRYLNSLILIFVIPIAALCLARLAVYVCDYVMARLLVDELMVDLERELPSV